ncbi:cell growth regulator with RING finger domain protein 1 [Corythoichthys intestinalis]|uniref:cell growth regulator with RING finger domain protein 1 n=1 Tax=Corythoichthys intestinalis TaxID=161448 RepID=UPI0025A68347|nr:cell growth regulator with RING finger domain protein 1 [Corythoichthys intestinalis]XP_061806829.1 cell growth regulator with RING finger domain protein 1-like [Nerophis lumbriciformis]
MAGSFLVVMYEYSPVFYICVVSLCFLVTAARVLGWVGFDFPVILRSSDDTESILPTPEKQMVQVTNPFSLEMGSGMASVADGVGLTPSCLEPCVLSCFWGCEVSVLQQALQAHQSGPRFSTPCHFQEALHPSYQHLETFFIGSEDREEIFTHIPADHGITNFGPLPRRRYPLVAVLTLAERDARNTYNIIAKVTVIHVPDDQYNLSARILFQYLLTSQGNLYELKALFMSANSSGESVHPDADPMIRPSVPEREEETKEEVTSVVEDDDEEDDEDWSEGRGRDCVVCQNAAINRVLLPCRHACVCNSCASHFQQCPICRAFIQESFALTLAPAAAQQ